MYIFTHTYICIYIYVCIHVHMYIYICVFAYIQVYMFIRMYILTQHMFYVYMICICNQTERNRTARNIYYLYVYLHA